MVLTYHSISILIFCKECYSVPLEVSYKFYNSFWVGWYRCYRTIKQREFLLIWKWGWSWSKGNLCKSIKEASQGLWESQELILSWNVQYYSFVQQKFWFMLPLTIINAKTTLCEGTLQWTIFHFIKLTEEGSVCLFCMRSNFNVRVNFKNIKIRILMNVAGSSINVKGSIHYT